jgi:RimJ/RimL family protein N-acetyltransferase
MNPAWRIATGRMVLSPTAWADLPDLQALKADPRVFAIMLGGVRTPQRTQEELAEDITTWARLGTGMWAVRQASDSAFLGIVGMMERPDGRGLSLRIAFREEAQGKGFAREAASAALRFTHENARIPRVVAVAREDNFASRTLLGGIGMVERDSFPRDGHRMVVYESVRDV